MRRILLLTLSVIALCGCQKAQEPAGGAQEVMENAETEKITDGLLEKVRISGAEVYALPGYEQDGNMIRAYMDGLSEDIFLENKDRQAALDEYAETYRGYMDSLGYKVTGDEILSQSPSSILQKLTYAGMVGGEERSGAYLLYSGDVLAGTVVYVINVPLSGLGDEGSAALGKLLEKLGESG